jgi:hypothetical protein
MDPFASIVFIETLSYFQTPVWSKNVSFNRFWSGCKRIAYMKRNGLYGVAQDLRGGEVGLADEGYETEDDEDEVQEITSAAHEHDGRGEAGKHMAAT